MLNVQNSYSMVARERSCERFPMSVKVSGNVLKQLSKFFYLGYDIKDKLDLSKSKRRHYKKAESSFRCIKVAGFESKCPYNFAKQLFKTLMASVVDFGSKIYVPNVEMKYLQLRFLKRFFDLWKSARHNATYAVSAFTS